MQSSYIYGGDIMFIVVVFLPCVARYHLRLAGFCQISPQFCLLAKLQILPQTSYLFRSSFAPFFTDFIAMTVIIIYEANITET